MREIVFLTGTRADSGKLKSLIEALRETKIFEVHIFATGMHLDKKYGYTVHEIEKCGYDNIYKFINNDCGAAMDITLSRTIEGFANYVRLIEPHLIVVHGDRLEALAGATVGAFNNIIVAHIEGGELSGTVDELIRHAVSKLSHTHFVANEEAQNRLIQMGEKAENIYVIGSPDMDVMVSDELPTFEEVAHNYELPFDDYAISMFHPVTTEYDNMDEYAKQYHEALIQSGENYVLIYPNNDRGSEFIFRSIKSLKDNQNFRVYPSVRFEAFLTLLKNAKFIIGNSSAGIREAPIYGIPTVNIGSRQNGRTANPHIVHSSYDTTDILVAINTAMHKRVPSQMLFGEGRSDEKFLDILSSTAFWKTPTQKLFADIAR